MGFFGKTGIESPIEQIKKEGFEEPESGEQGGFAVVSSEEGAETAKRVEQMRDLGLPEDFLKLYEEEISKSDLEKRIKNDKRILLPAQSIPEKFREGLEPGIAETGYCRGLPGTEAWRFPLYIKYVDSGKNIAFVALDAGQIKEFSDFIKEAEQSLQDKTFELNEAVENEFDRVLEKMGFDRKSYPLFQKTIEQFTEIYNKRKEKEEAQIEKQKFDF